jgi:heptosyltransferase-1
MKVLIVKTSSMGDIIHTLPALSDAVNAIAGIRFDWVVEESFKQIPHWHSGVDKVIPVAIRRWRKSPYQAWRSGEWKVYKKNLQEREYDVIIDAQGLLKSALLVVKQAHGPSFGLDNKSAKEPLASKFYNTSFSVDKNQHAVERVRQLFAKALGYQLPSCTGDFAICEHFEQVVEQQYLVFNHGTTRIDKHYPEVYWLELIKTAVEQGWHIKLPWGNDEERARAERLAGQFDQVEVLPKLSLCEVAQIIGNASGCISVDTGLAHLSAAMSKPNITLFGPTDPGLVGGYGKNQQVLLAKDFEIVDRQVEPAVFNALTPKIVWGEFDQLMQSPLRK